MAVSKEVARLGACAVTVGEMVARLVACNVVNGEGIFDVGVVNGKRGAFPNAWRVVIGATTASSPTQRYYIDHWQLAIH